MSPTIPDASPVRSFDELSLSWLCLGAPEAATVRLRCLDAGDDPAEAIALGDGLWTAPAAGPRGAMRWRPQDVNSLFPALSVHERARVHVSLAPGVTLSEVPGRLVALDARRGSHLWILDGQSGIGALVVRVEHTTRRLPVWVRARWDESPSLVTAGLRELSALRWSAAVREASGRLRVPVGWARGARREPAEERLVLEVLAGSAELREAIGSIARAPASAMRLDVARVSPAAPRASELLAARGMDPAVAWATGHSLLLPQPVASRVTPEARLLRTLLDALEVRAEQLGDAAGGLRETFAAWRREVPWIEAVPAVEGPVTRPRQEVHQALARALEALDAWRPTLDPADEPGVSVWDSPRVYERWCALELCRALDLSDDTARRLLRGERAEASLAGGPVTLEAQRCFPSPSPLAFRPDLAVTRGDRRVLLDAKYRLEPSREAQGLPREELVKMHAYRDAIPGAVGAYALFPGEASEAVDARDPRGGVGAIALKADLDPAARRVQREGLQRVVVSLLG